MIDPGIYHDIPIDEYHRSNEWADMLNASALKKLKNRTPRHFMASKTAPQEPPTPAMQLGSLIHLAVLEPSRFAASTIIQPEEGIDRRTKAGKEAWAEFEASANGKQIITAEQAAICAGVLDSLHSGCHQTALNLLTNGVPEVSVVWNDPSTEERCKCRPDYLRDDHIIVEVKTTSGGADWPTFRRVCGNLDYDLAAAWYMGGAKEATGHKHEYIFIVIETFDPYEIAVYMPDDIFFDNGRVKVREALDKYVQAKASNVWAGYPDEIQLVTLPPWAVV